MIYLYNPTIMVY